MVEGRFIMAKNQIDYIASYNKENYKMYPFRVKKSEKDLIDKLESVANRNKYITDLLLEDIHPSILTIKQIKDKIKPVMDKHGVCEVYLFGSYARGEANRNSDVDIYCDSGGLRTLYDEVDFINELEDALGKKVDVVTIGSEMHAYFKQQLEKDMIRLW